jgi:hypothetical protein
MKKIFLGLGAVLLVVVVVVVAAAAMQPSEMRVERTHVIDAPSTEIVGQLTDLHRWAEWNPWGELDPDMRLAFSEPAVGVDAWYTWDGNDDVGSGRMQIIEATSGRVRYALEFVEPFASEAEVEIALEPSGETTRVVWVMTGQNDFMTKVMRLFMDIDGMIGADFERGLANLDAAVTG